MRLQTPAPHFYTMWRFLIRNDLDLSKQSSKSRSMSEASQEVIHEVEKMKLTDDMLGGKEQAVGKQDLEEVKN